MKYQKLQIPISSKDPKYSMVWYYMKRRGKTYEEALALIEKKNTPPPLVQEEKKKPNPCPEDDPLWFITNDLATLNRRMGELIGALGRIEALLAKITEIK
jgi:hypothetical protein